MKHLKKFESFVIDDISLMQVLNAWILYNNYKKYGFNCTLKHMGNNLKELMKDFIEYSTTIYGTTVTKDMTEYQFRELLNKFKSDNTK